MRRSQYSGAIQNVEVQRFVRVDPASFALSGQALSNECWRASRGVADWVIVTDIDEHLYHSDLFTLLIRYKAQATTFIPELGYQMISEKFPGPSERALRDPDPGRPVARDVQGEPLRSDGD